MVDEYTWMVQLVGQLAVVGAFDLVSGVKNIPVVEEAESLEEEGAKSQDESRKTLVKQLSATKSKKTNNHKMEEPIVLNPDLD